MKKLYLITETFPYGKGEKTFILPELTELIKNYDVTIVSHAIRKEIEDKQNETILDNNIKVIHIPIQLPWYKRIYYILRFFCDKDGYQELKTILKEKESIFYRTYQSIGFYALAMENFRLMKSLKLFSNREEVIYYTYWYFYYTYSMTKYKDKYSQIKLVTRTHGFDLYDERYRGKRQPFKLIMDKKIDKVVFISNQGKTYYLNQYGIKDSSKYVVSRMGTLKTVADTEKKRSDIFRIVSCSSVIPLKRVDLIIESLQMIAEEIEWVHFGTGIEFEKVVKLADALLGKKKNIHYSLRGAVKNEDIMQFYDTNYVNCFISTSSSEGVPVSIQEAISFGIPVIATNVGGVAELFNGNGVLLEAQPSVQNVADAIRKIMYLETSEYELLRKNSYSIWAESYNAEENRVKFINMLNEL